MWLWEAVGLLNREVGRGLVLSLCIPFPHQICLFIYLFIVSLYLGNKYNKDRDIVAFLHFYMDPGTATWYVIILMFTHF